MLYVLILLSKLIMWPYSLVIWPVAYIFRAPVREYYFSGSWQKRILAFPLWITLNDRYMDYGESWWRDQQKLPIGFRMAWLWSWARNNSDNWNYYVVRKKPEGPEEVITSWTTDDRDPLLHRRFKWEYWSEGKWAGDWSTNQGDRLSQERTWLGTSFCTYGWKYMGFILTSGEWRFSHAGIHMGLMINIKMGYNDLGEALLDFKVKRFKPYYTAHWSTKQIL